MIEQRLIAGQVAGGAEIIDRLHQALSNQPRPNPIDHDARGQWIAFGGDPVG